MLPNLQLMDEPLSEPENLSDKQSGALSGAACGDNAERGGRAGKGNVRDSGDKNAWKSPEFCWEERAGSWDCWAETGNIGEALRHSDSVSS